MTGVFLQPLDRTALRHAGDFSVAENGSVVLLERSTGELLRLARANGVYDVAARGSSYGAGARLLSSSRGHWIATPNGESTAVVRVSVP